MFLPQRAIAAPGATLLEQLIYPSALRDSPASLDLQHAAHLLQDVGLTDLLQRVDGDWLRQEDWQGERLLSKSCSCLDSAGCSPSTV